MYCREDEVKDRVWLIAMVVGGNGVGTGKKQRRDVGGGLWVTPAWDIPRNVTIRRLIATTWTFHSLGLTIFIVLLYIVILSISMSFFPLCVHYLRSHTTYVALDLALD